MKYKIQTTVSMGLGVFLFLVVRRFLISDPKSAADLLKTIFAATAGGILAGLTSYCIMWLSEVIAAHRKTPENIKGKK